MTPELTALALAGLLQAAQFGLFATPANIELTPAYTTSPRDAPPPRPLSKITARLQRALTNHFEGLILFTLAVVVGGKGAATFLCAGKRSARGSPTVVDGLVLSDMLRITAHHTTHM